MKTKVCRRCNRRKPVEHFGRKTRHKDGLVNRCRSCESIRKRESRARAAARPTEPPDSIHRRPIPASRLVPILNKWRETNNVSFYGEGTQRRIWAIINEQEITKWDTADKLLIELDLDHLWHVPAERGGLADLYEFESCVGRTAGAGGRNASSPKRGRVRRAPAPPQRKAA